MITNNSKKAHVAIKIYYEINFNRLLPFIVDCHNNGFGWLATTRYLEEQGIINNKRGKPYCIRTVGSYIMKAKERGFI